MGVARIHELGRVCNGLDRDLPLELVLTGGNPRADRVMVRWWEEDEDAQPE